MSSLSNSQSVPEQQVEIIEKINQVEQVEKQYHENAEKNIEILTSGESYVTEKLWALGGIIKNKIGEEIQTLKKKGIELKAGAMGVPLPETTNSAEQDGFPFKTEPFRQELEKSAFEMNSKHTEGYDSKPYLEIWKEKDYIKTQYLENRNSGDSSTQSESERIVPEKLVEMKGWKDSREINSEVQKFGADFGPELNILNSKLPTTEPVEVEEIIDLEPPVKAKSSNNTTSTVIFEKQLEFREKLQHELSSVKKEIMKEINELPWTATEEEIVNPELNQTTPALSKAELERLELQDRMRMSQQQPAMGGR